MRGLWVMAFLVAFVQLAAPAASGDAIDRPTGDALLHTPRGFVARHRTLGLRSGDGPGSLQRLASRRLAGANPAQPPPLPAPASSPPQATEPRTDAFDGAAAPPSTPGLALAALTAEHGTEPAADAPPPPPQAPPPPACPPGSVCSANATCTPRPTRKNPSDYACACNDGFAGNPYLASGPEACRPEGEHYLDELFGKKECLGCAYVASILDGYRGTVAKVLDVGVGECGAVNMLKARGKDTRGVELPSVPLGEGCADLLAAGLVVKAPFDALPYANASFDLVVALHTLEYLPLEHLGSVLREMHRVSRGRVMIAVRVPDFKADDFGATGKYGSKPSILFPEGWWSERVSAAGFRATAAREDMLRAAYRSSQKKRASKNIAILAFLKEPTLKQERAVLADSNCAACPYMPVVYHMFAPPEGVDDKRKDTKLTFGASLLISPNACQLVRGLLAAKPRGMKAFLAWSPFEFPVERDCPDLLDAGQCALASSNCGRA